MSSKHAKIGAESFGIVVCRFVGTVPDVFGLVWTSFRPRSGSKSKIPGRILKSVRGPLAQPSYLWGAAVPQNSRLVFGGSAFQTAPRPPQRRIRTTGAGLCYAIVLAGRRLGLRAGLQPDSIWESFEIGPPAGLQPAGGPILMFSRLESGQNPARKPDFRPGGTIV